ncbi:hypothetical protein KBF38_16960 [bacterium]|nr:hypothetical protein [bacterium]
MNNMFTVAADDNALRVCGRGAVALATILLRDLEPEAIGIKLVTIGESNSDSVCIGLELPEFVYELNDGWKWSARMINSKGRTWLISAGWVLNSQHLARIKGLYSVNGAGRVKDYL